MSERCCRCCDECATLADYRRGSTLDETYRHGGHLQEDRESGGRDLVTEMKVLSSRPEVLANALAEMGVGRDGDGLPDEGEDQHE